ncbi:MAG: 5-formyltetrahydrofolate cyclo-ligase [Polyangiales bacterium]
MMPPSQPLALASDPVWIARAKQHLRAQMRAVRGQLPAAAVAARSRRIVTALCQLIDQHRPPSVALFAPLRHEVQLLPALVDEAASPAPTWLLPRIAGASEQTGTPAVMHSGEGLREQGLTLHIYSHDTALQRGAFGVRQPPEDTPTMPDDAVAWVIAPALAVDSDGCRLGYGGGHYDRLLARLPHALVVVVAFDFQLLVELPRAAHDRPGHVVVTDARVHWAAGRPPAPGSRPPTVAAP